MGILNIAPAERAGAHLLIQLYGPPRSGKTYTALRIARGMVGPTGRIGMLDTESGRARLYSDKVPGGFVLGELTPPYTPRRYLEAIEEFLAYGVDPILLPPLCHPPRLRKNRSTLTNALHQAVPKPGRFNLDPIHQMPGLNA